MGFCLVKINDRPNSPNLKEFILDSVSDKYNLPLDVADGSIAYTKTLSNIYIFKSGSWVEVIQNSGGGLPIHICTSDEYNHQTGFPTVSSPDKETLYLVPASPTSTGNLFNEWVYVNSTWEKVGAVDIEIPQSDWTQNDTTAVDYIKHKPTIPAAQVQANWAQTDSTAVDYIKNKPSTALGVGF